MSVITKIANKIVRMIVALYLDNNSTSGTKNQKMLTNFKLKFTSIASFNSVPVVRLCRDDTTIMLFVFL